MPRADAHAPRQDRALVLLGPAALVLAVLLDQLGEPPNAVHPVVGIGWLIERGVRHAPSVPHRQLPYGFLLVIGTAAVAASTGMAVERGLRRWPLVSLLATAALLKTTFAHRALLDAASAVHRPLATGDLTQARAMLRSLVSRERDQLSEHQVAAAAIESVGENLSDSVVAPLLAYAIGGLPAALAYRAINTADAMIGYHGRFEYLGKAAARLDDLLNLLPARLTAIMIAFSAGEQWTASWQIAWRDHGLTASPNAGWPMAAMAGTLDVALEKVDHYRLNAAGRPPTAADLARAISLARRPALLAMALALVVTGLRAAATAKVAQPPRSA